MARNYANIWTAIWLDPDFRALAPGPQRTYLLLMSQPDISAAGVLPLTMQRWADMAKGTTRESIRSDLLELHRARFVSVDPSTEELLVRTFVKWDGGYGNPKRRPVILRAAGEIQSATLRQALAVEFVGLGLPTAFAPDPPTAAVSSQANSLSVSHSAPDVLPIGIDAAGLSPSDGVVVTKAVVVPTSTHNPQPTNPVPPPAGETPSASADDLGHDDEPPVTAQALLGEYIDMCAQRPPRRVLAPLGKILKELLDEGINPEDIRRGLKEWHAKRCNPSALPGFVNQILNPPDAMARASPNGRQYGTPGAGRNWQGSDNQDFDYPKEFPV